MSHPSQEDSPNSPLSLDQLIEQVCGPFEAALKATAALGPTPRVEDYLSQARGAERSAILRELVLLEVHYRHRRGESPQTAEYCARFPELNPEWLIDVLEAAPTKVQGALPGVPASTAPGMLIGPYKLLQQIGQGGMGTVFLAEQLQPLQRTVALKLIQPGLDSRQVLARFEAERQALALMDHPNIAKVFDAGTVPGEPGGVSAGRPYFVMELVKGVPITTYCDTHRLTLRQRLELFIPVCHAVQHAHQKGIIHRDLKPSNILTALYDDRPMPKVIDFGVAKATAIKLTEETLTDFGSVVGTLEYMSPEQAEPGQPDIDTRSDIYSLGVVLYELLTGTTPLQPLRRQGATLWELLRMVREEEPPTPSTRLDTTDELPAIAANRGLEPKKLRGLIQGDLDWIVMKCLEKDRTRRYETASALARDVERYLNEEPVEASPPSAGYRLRKFARKNRKLLGVAAAFALLLAAGTVVSSWQAVRASRERNKAVAEKDRAEEQVAIAKAVNEFLQKDLLGQADIANQPVGMERNRNLPVRELLDRAAQRIGGQFQGQQKTEAAIRLTLGNAYRALGEFAEAQKHLERSLALRKELLGPSHLDTLETTNALGALHFAARRYDQAEPLWKEVLEELRRNPDTAQVEALPAMKNLALLYQQQGRYDDAEALLKQSLEGLRVQGGMDHPSTLRAMNHLALLYKARGRYDDAESLLKESLEKDRDQLGSDHPQTINTMSYLASLYRDQRRYTEAEAFYKQVVELRRAKLGADHPDTLINAGVLAQFYEARGRYSEALPLFKQVVEGLGADHPETLKAKNSLAQVYQELGRYEEAARLSKELVEACRVKLGPNHPHTLIAINNLAMHYQSTGRHDEAERLFKQAVNGSRTSLGADHVNTLRLIANLAAHYMDRGQYSDAEPLFKEVLEARQKKLGPDHLDTLKTMNKLAVLYRETGRHDQAEPLFKEVLEARCTKLGPDHADTLGTENELALLYQERGQYGEAEPLFREAATGAKKRLGMDDSRTQRFINNQADLLSKQGKLQLAESLLRELVAFLRGKPGADSPVYASQLARLSQNLLEQMRFTEAEQVAREALVIQTNKEPDAWTTFNTQSLLGGALLGQKKYADAEPLLVQGYEGMKKREAKIPKNLKVRQIEALERLVQLYDAWGKPDRAAEWRKKLEATKANLMN
jgi:serine/threonine protein kinase/tetratricopeptide (TPR) repeat protein